VKAVNGNTESVSELAEHLKDSFMKLRGDSDQGIMFVYDLGVSGENCNRGAGTQIVSLCDCVIVVSLLMAMMMRDFIIMFV